MKYKITPAVLFLFHFTFGQQPPITRLDGSKISASEIDKTVARLMSTANIQGLSLAILNNKKTVFIKSYGYRNKPRNELLDTASIMYGASLSKAVFGYLTMKLVQDKILNLDKPLYQYLPKPLYEYEYFSDLKSDDRWKLITARMCLSHPTGRLIGRRPENAVDLHRVYEVAREHGVAVEVNGLPPRLDLRGEHVRDAIAAGVKIVCSTDAHAPQGLANMRYAVATARRGGATPQDVLNTGSRDPILGWRSGAR